MNLTDEGIRIKVVEAMGWVWNEQTVIAGILFRQAWSHYAHGFRYSIHDLPNYPESLDACAEFEATLTDEEWLDYMGYLSAEVLGYSCSMKASWSLTRKLLETTTRQRCLAYLKTKGLIPRISHLHQSRRLR